MSSDLLLNGSSGLNHEHSSAICEAARFPAATPPGERPKPLVPALRAIFGISSLEAVQAIRQSPEIGGAA